VSTNISSSPPERVIQTAVATPFSDGADERWRAWQQKGAAHDRAVRRRLTIVVPIVLIFVVVFYVFVVR
jgi:CHASE3 domain sensor protein